MSAFRRAGLRTVWMWSLLGTVAAAQDPPCSQTLACSLARTHTSGTRTMSYRLFLPPDYEQASENYPLVVFLHGAGERGTDNLKQVSYHIDGLIDATQTSEFASFLVAPQLRPGGGDWSPRNANDLTLDIIENLTADYPIDPTRIYLTGLSLGGIGTTRYVWFEPDLFAAAVPMSGAISPLTPSQADTIRDVPFWLFHGDLDTVLPVSRSRNFVSVLEAAGGTPRYTEIAGGGHVIWSPIYSDWQHGTFGLYEWMFAQATAQPIPEPSSIVLLTVGLLGLAGARRRAHVRPVTSKP